MEKWFGVNPEETMTKIMKAIVLFNLDPKKVAKLNPKALKSLFKLYYGATSKDGKSNFEKYAKFARKIAAYLRKQKVKVAVLDVISGFPRVTMSDLAWEFIANRGSIIVVINRLKEPEKLCKNKSSGNFSHIHISIRVSKKVDFKANIFAEKIGGGGHEKAAGARIPIRKYYYILGKIIEELSLYQKPVSYFRIDENMLSEL